MSSIKALDDELNRMIEEGRAFPEAFHKFYADDVVMIEGTGESCEGREANIHREAELAKGVKEMHGARLLGAVAGDDLSFSEWEYEMTFQDGRRVTWAEVARRQWKDGKIVNERFYYYNPA